MPMDRVGFIGISKILEGTELNNKMIKTLFNKNNYKLSTQNKFKPLKLDVIAKN